MQAATRTVDESDRREELERKLEEAVAQQSRTRAWAEREVERSRENAREAGVKLLELEAERARELEAFRAAEEELEALREEHQAAHETIQMMQRTRLWRIGASYWRLREKLFSRTAKHTHSR